MTIAKNSWLLLVTNLPGQSQTLRMRIWRALKAAGAGLLRDGVYVLPHAPDSRQLFEDQAREIRAAAGGAHILKFEADSAGQQDALVALFDRSADYQELIACLGAWRKKLPKQGELEARKILATITREAGSAAAIDLFPGKPREQMHIALAEAESAMNARFSPDEPSRPIERSHAVTSRTFNARLGRRENTYGLIASALRGLSGALLTPRPSLSGSSE